MCCQTMIQQICQVATAFLPGLPSLKLEGIYSLIKIDYDTIYTPGEFLLVLNEDLNPVISHLIVRANLKYSDSFRYVC